MNKETEIRLKVNVTDVQLFIERLKELAEGGCTVEDLLRTISFTDREVAEDPVVEANRYELRRRSQVGIEKYGTKLDRNDFSENDWLQHLLEELLDAANYTQALLRMRREVTRVIGPDIAWLRNLWAHYNANIDEMRKIEQTLHIKPEDLDMTPNELSKMQERYMELKKIIREFRNQITTMLQDE